MTYAAEDIFIVPAATSKAEIKVKGSRFIAIVLRAKTKEDAEASYLQIKKENFNATHNCFAYRIDGDVFRYSDDGEPSGTAGKPILQTLEGMDLQQALCVVTRYFGGTKLGTGGLIRAYSDSAQAALNVLQAKTLVRTGRLILRFSYDLENLIRRELTLFNGKIISSDYSEQIKMEQALPLSKIDEFEHTIIEKTNALVQITRI